MDRMICCSRNVHIWLECNASDSTVNLFQEIHFGRLEIHVSDFHSEYHQKCACSTFIFSFSVHRNGEKAPLVRFCNRIQLTKGASYKYGRHTGAAAELGWKYTTGAEFRSGNSLSACLPRAWGATRRAPICTKPIIHSQTIQTAFCNFYSYTFTYTFVLTFMWITQSCKLEWNRAFLFLHNLKKTFWNISS